MINSGVKGARSALLSQNPGRRRLPKPSLDVPESLWVAARDQVTCRTSRLELLEGAFEDLDPSVEGARSSTYFGATDEDGMVAECRSSNVFKQLDVSVIEDRKAFDI